MFSNQKNWFQKWFRFWDIWLSATQISTLKTWTTQGHLFSKINIIPTVSLRKRPTRTTLKNFKWKLISKLAFEFSCLGTSQFIFSTSSGLTGVLIGLDCCVGEITSESNFSSFCSRLSNAFVAWVFNFEKPDFKLLIQSDPESDWLRPRVNWDARSSDNGY